MAFSLAQFPDRILRILWTILAVLCAAMSVISVYRYVVVRPFSNDECVWIHPPNRTDQILIRQIVPGGVADEAGLRENDTLLTINSRGFNHLLPAQAIIDAMPKGSYAHYQIKRGNELLDKYVRIKKVIDINLISNFLLGFTFLLVGYITIIAKPRGDLQLRLWKFCLSAVAYTGFQLWRDIPTLLRKFPGWPATIHQGLLSSPIFPLVLLGIIAVILAPPQFVMFFLDFPTPYQGSKRKRRIISILLYGTMTCAFIGAISSANLFEYIGLNRLIIPSIAFILGIIIFFVKYTSQVPKEKSQRSGPLPIRLS